MQPANLVDLMLINGKIITMAEDGRIAEAVAIKGDKIIAIGSTTQIMECIGPDTKLIDLQGRTVTPGFVESHCHTSTAGVKLVFEVIVKGAQSIDEIIEMMKGKAKKWPSGKWIIGSNYDDRHLAEKRHPTRWDLDKVSNHHPIFLRRLDGHLAVVNSEALKLANITKNTPDPDGGKIDRVDGTGEPNGLLRELAQDLVLKYIPLYSVQEIKQGIQEACQKLASWGITSFTDTIVDHDSLVAYQELLFENRLPLRAGIVIPWFPLLGHPGYAKELKTLGLRAGYGSNRLRIVGTKFMADGSMSGWTAALHRPYSNEPDNCGLIVIPLDQLTKGIVEAHKQGLRPCIHAIGDKAIDVVLDVIEEALKERPASDHRIRIEHCSLPTEEALKRIKRLGVIPSSAVGFLYELGSAHLMGLGPERIRRYLPHRTYLEMGILSVGHSDWLVTSAEILQQVHGAVNRKSYLGESIGAEQAISTLDALRLYTINAAYASFEENIKGSIEPGKLADMAVLDRDVLTIPKEEIKNVKVDTTIVGGAIVYQRTPKSGE
ncbi:MAG: amidohydrolase [Deltaproteobacteria bacterium]|nr:amidohydrolase [Deltaproteobacteria bacterium]